MSRQLCDLAIELHIPVFQLEQEDERTIATYLDLLEDRQIAEKLAMKGMSNG